MTAELQCLWRVEATLGEGPVWSTTEQCLWFVDIKQQLIHRFDPASGETRSWSAPAQPGFIVPIAARGNAPRSFIVGLKTGLHRFYPDTERFELLLRVEDPALNNRLNDACVDTHGRLWFGSMHDDEQTLTGALYSFDHHGLRRHDSGYCITNGPAFSPDGNTLYHTDTLQRAIYAFDVSADGLLHDKRVFARIAPELGYPDGLVTDMNGELLTGLFGGWGLLRLSVAGQVLEHVKLPCANVTKACFGGADLRTLYITTARKGLSAEQLAEQPLAGSVFSVRATTPGLPQQEVQLEQPCFMPQTKRFVQ